MIQVTRLDGSELYLNAEFIQSVESTPDTHIVLVNGYSYVVTEADAEVVERVLAYRRSVYAPAPDVSSYGHLRSLKGSTGG